VNDQIDRHCAVCKLDGPQHLFGIFDVNETHYGESEQAHRLLPMNKGNHPAAAKLFDITQRACATCLKQLLSADVRASLLSESSFAESIAHQRRPEIIFAHLIEFSVTYDGKAIALVTGTERNQAIRE
jgi:hypothetical protein